MAACQARTASGDPCRMSALAESDFCFSHDPAIATERARARKLGGRNRHTPHVGDPESIPAKIETIRDAGAILSYTLAELLAHENSIPRARALLAIFDSFVKAIEIGELEQRIAALEARQK